MTELKTLKELSMYRMGSGEERKFFAVELGELKTEAVKWVKNSYKLQQEFGNKEQYEGFRYAFTEFFNLTEEDIS